MLRLRIAQKVLKLKIGTVAATCLLSALVAGGAVYFFDRYKLSESSRPIRGMGGLDICRPSDTRIPVPVWTPQLRDGKNLTDDPPTNDGQLIFIEFSSDNSELGCASANPDKLYSISKPVDPKDAMMGGLAVNFRGNVQFHNGFCTFRGFFMNQRVGGMHQGWIETYFGAVDTFEVIKSNRYCATQGE